MSKLRVYEMAREYNVPTSVFLKILNKSGVQAKNKGSYLPERVVESFKQQHTREEVQGMAETYRRERDSQNQNRSHRPQPDQSPKENEGKGEVAAKADAHDASGKEGERHDQSSGNSRRRKNRRRNRNRNKQNAQGEQAQQQASQASGEQRQERPEQPRQAREDERHQDHHQRERRPRRGSRGQRDREAQQNANASGKARQPRGEHTGQSRQPEGQPRNARRGQQHSEGPRAHQGGHDQRQTGSQPRGGQQRVRNTRPGASARGPMAVPPPITGGGKQGRKRKKNTYKDKKAERPIKIRDNRKRTKSKHTEYRKERVEKPENPVVYEIPEVLTIAQFANIVGVRPEQIIQRIIPIGLMVKNINEEIDAETAQIIGDEMGFEIKPISSDDVVQKIFDDYDQTVTGNEKKRPPVVTVMGHVDHGKTSLLDQIRKTNVTAGEAGGITQHIGAYTVKANNETITFIDTPGHAAFTAMRSRGAQMTDIAVLVVAADDGVMPQTIEAINHAKAAEVPIIVAINKIDKDGSNPERVKQELTEQGLLIEEWGGDVIAVPISAREGTNVQDLLESILLVAEMEELSADPDRNARGSVIEAEVKKGKGSTASLLIKQGTLKVGDTILSGATYGKIRTMIDDKGKRIRKAGPSMPVEVSGLQGLPEAGEDFIVLEDEKQARQLAQQKAEIQKRMERAKKAKVSLDTLFDRIKEGVTDINIILKADVQGSVEALAQSLVRLSTDEIRVNVIHSAVGAINETDVMLASTTGAVIIGFNVRSDKMARDAAEREQVDIRYYSVIYNVLEDLKKAMEGLLKPEFVEKHLGEAEVRETFKLPNGTMVAGSYVIDGKITRNKDARLLRDGVVVYQSSIDSLRRFKDDVREVNQGFECGIVIQNMNDIQVGDVIEVFEMEAVKRELEAPGA